MRSDLKLINFKIYSSSFIVEILGKTSDRGEWRPASRAEAE